MPGVDTVRLGQFELSLSTIEDLEKLFIILYIEICEIAKNHSFLLIILFIAIHMAIVNCWKQA